MEIDHLYGYEMPMCLQYRVMWHDFTLSLKMIAYCYYIATRHQMYAHLSLDHCILITQKRMPPWQNSYAAYAISY